MTSLWDFLYLVFLCGLIVGVFLATVYGVLQLIFNPVGAFNFIFNTKSPTPQEPPAPPPPPPPPSPETTLAGFPPNVVDALKTLTLSLAGRFRISSATPEYNKLLADVVSSVRIHFPKPAPVTDGLPFPIRVLDPDKIYNSLLIEANYQFAKTYASDEDAFNIKNEKEYLEAAAEKFARTTFMHYIHEEPPTSPRFQGTWIVAPTGHGKSSFLSYLIQRDLEKVAKGKATVVVMESKRDLFTSIQGLARFGPGGDLEGKLVSLDIEDIEYPLALNLFDIGEIGELPPKEAEITFNAINAMFQYVFRALLDAELSSRMTTMFTALSRLMLKIPNATIDTMREIAEPNGLERYQRYVDELDPDARSFFNTKWKDKSDTFTNQTKQIIVDRIFTVKMNVPALGRMLSATKSSIDFYDLMASPKVILISYPKGMFFEEGTEILGRFFLSQIITAAQRRQFLEKKDRLPTFIYIDEAHDVIRRDERLEKFLDQSRALNIGLTFAHQRVDDNQLTPSVFRTLSGTMAMVFAAELSDQNAKAMAPNMKCKPEFIVSAPKHRYAAYIRGFTDNAVSYRPPYVDFMKQDRMSEEHLNEHRRQMRERFSQKPGATRPPPEPPPAPKKEPQLDTDPNEYT